MFSLLLILIALGAPVTLGHRRGPDWAIVSAGITNVKKITPAVDAFLRGNGLPRLSALKELVRKVEEWDTGQAQAGQCTDDCHGIIDDLRSVIEKVNLTAIYAIYSLSHNVHYQLKFLFNNSYARNFTSLRFNQYELQFTDLDLRVNRTEEKLKSAEGSLQFLLDNLLGMLRTVGDLHRDVNLLKSHHTTQAPTTLAPTTQAPTTTTTTQVQNFNVTETEQTNVSFSGG